MKKHIIFTVLILIVALSSCSNNLDSEDFIDMSTSFILKTNTTNSQTGLTESKSQELAVNSKKWISFIKWSNMNKRKWQKSPASHIGDTYVTQGDFRLIYTKNSKGVVIAFKDSKGNPKQYSKGIGEHELDFLYGK